MKRKNNQKLLAFSLAMVFLFSCVLTSVAATVPAGGAVTQTVVQKTGLSGSAAGLKDYSIPTNQKHAYDPFAQMETEEATEAYRQSVQYEAGTIIFKLSATDTFILGEDRKTEDEALSALGIDPSSMVELSKRMVDDGFFRDDYEIIYQADLTGDVWEAVDALAETEGVVAAQPNYLYEDAAIGLPTPSKNPYMGEQWYLDSLEASQSWIELYGEDLSPGEGTIVAVIDSGVDYTHPDLAANMWVNTAELNGVAGVDDDKNGYVDDIYGASTVGASPFHSGDPMDYFGHGTHVAGIIAMTSNNYEGGVGMAYGTKIMAIKAGGETGSLSDVDIAEAINYAVANGADVINMSFGGAGKSFLVEEALSEAFNTCVLVAAAGNSSAPTADAPPEFTNRADFYPAGYTYVLGVMATNPNDSLANFSNWDYVFNGGSAEYELAAPGVDIYSTIPGGGYASWDGTSMAAPIVSAVAAMLRGKYSDKETYSSRYIMGQLASATDKGYVFYDKIGWPHLYYVLDLFASLFELPKPNVTVYRAYLFDSPEIDPANDGDGIIDAGETIDLGLVLRNQWGMAENVTVTVDAITLGGVSNPNIEWITDTIQMDPIGTFNEQDNSFVWENDALVGTENPIRFKVKETAINNADIGFNIKVTCTNAMDSSDPTVYTYDPDGYEMTFYVQRGRTLSGTITEDMTLTAEDYWIIENAVYIPKGVTVTVEPGTQIQFWGTDPSDPHAAATMAYIEVDGTFLARGTEENPIEMFPSSAYYAYGVDLRGGVNEDYATHPASSTVGRTELSHVKVINPLLNYNEGDHLYLVQNDQTIVYRELRSGTMYEFFGRGGIVHCNRTADSQLVNFNFSLEKNSGLRYIAGSFERVLFQGCFADDLKPDFTSESVWRAVDCVFVGENTWEGKGLSLINPLQALRMPDMETSQIYTFGESKYLIVEWKNRFVGSMGYQIGDSNKTSGSYDAVEFFAMQELAAKRGGSLAILNTAEERAFLQETVTSFGKVVYIGWYRPNDGLGAWLNEANGIDISGNVSTGGFNLKNDQFGTIHSDGSLYQADHIGTNNIALYEFPATVSDEAILKIFSQAEYLAALEIAIQHSPLELEGFTNNAILNSFEKSSDYNWNKLSTDLDRSYVMSATNNYWGTTNEKLIQAQIQDADSYAGLADIVTTPYLTLESPELETIYPFVTEAYITDTEGNRIATCGNQGIQIHVKFNRDMDQTVDPMVSYGPSAPYTDYVLEGEWVSPREWVGTTQITSVIDSGTEYIRVKDAVAADDGWLKTGTDETRFSFTIQRTGAQAMALQAEGGENKISLNWYQDDYATLAGYNVYRATSADGAFTKINTRMIPGTVREFVDTDVEPGKEYFYYFTVLTTSLTESNPSNVASATALDNVKPILNHTAVTKAAYGTAISFSATATDNIGIEFVRVYYRAKGESAYKTLNLSNTEGINYYGVIAANEVSANGMEYYLEASDGTSYARYGSNLYPLQIAVDHSLTIYSVSTNKVDTETVTEGITAIVSGANFTEGMTLQVGNVTVDYELISESQLSFTVPAGNIGRVDIVLTDGARSARLSNAITYVDGDAYAQIVAPGEAKSNEQIKLPILISADGAVDGVDLQLNLTKDLYSNISFEPAESTMMYSCKADLNGVVKISVISIEAMDLSKPIGYLVLDLTRVTEPQLTSIEISAAAINAIALDSLMGCNLEMKPNFTVSGKITYYNSNEGIAGVTVRLDNGMTAVTDENGVYTFTGITTNVIVITPEFKGSVNGAISAQDSALVLQAITGEGAELDGLFYIAADVDGDGQLTAKDASAILKKSIGAIEGDFDGSGREWTFDQTAKVLTLTDNVSNADFQGILLGDVTGNWTSTPVAGLE